MGFGDKLREAIEKLRKATFVDKDLIKEVIRELQRALIASDVEISLVLKLSKEIEEQAFIKLPDELERKEHVVKVTYDKLVEVLGGTEQAEIKDPSKILMVGLFGSGKTSTTGKIAKYYQKRGKSIGVIGCDVFRPAALQQLQQLLAPLKIEVYGNEKEKNAANVVKEGLKKFKEKEIIIVDSAGRSALDDELVDEIKQVNSALKPSSTILVLSADIGQTAKKQAHAFQESVGVNGIIITKLDGSGKGGGVLAACHATQAPVVFIGTGEKLDDLQEFNATRFLSRVMGYGDLQSLIEKVKEIEINQDFNPEQLLSGNFTLKTFREQLKAMKKVGTFSKIADMMGFGTKMPAQDLELTQDKMNDFEIIMQSMTKQEMDDDELINSNRIKRIAKGSGKNEASVRELLKQFRKMKKIMGSFSDLQDLQAGENGQIDQKQMQKMMSKLKGIKGLVKQKKIKF